MMNRSVSGYLTLGGQVVMWRAAAGRHAAARRRLLFCQKLGGQLPTLPTRHLRPCYVLKPADFEAQRSLL